MRCHQCERPALYQMEENVPLCLDCYRKVVEVHNIQFLQNAAMMNQAMDDMDMISGMPMQGGRIPVAELARATQGKTKAVYNNIKIEGSSIGVVNTGDLARIDAVITLTKGTDSEEIGKHLKELTEIVIKANEIENANKQELIDLIQSFSEQIAGVQGKSKKSVALSLLKGIEDHIKTVPAAFFVYEKMKPLVVDLFNVGIGQS